MTDEKAIEILLKEVDGIPSDVWDESAEDFADAVQIAVYAIKQIAEDYGKWIIHKDFNESIKFGCNKCGNLANIKSRFCPNCGKRMLKGAEK